MHTCKLMVAATFIHRGGPLVCFTLQIQYNKKNLTNSNEILSKGPSVYEYPKKKI